ncbi:MAG TPA: CDP-alcohol phosphatidyltransferase family protein, partial [Gemmatimonas sp.]|nr:CDP-alcohol phosphatidyltransferase family protein [Gemmatimonas sp.]
MFDHLLRNFKDQLLAPLARLIGASVPPNMLSLLAFAFGIGCAVAAFQGHDAAAVVLWLVNRTIDGLDGTHARVHQQQSDFGGYLDIVLDFAVYAAIPCVLVVASPGLQLAPA